MVFKKKKVEVSDVVEDSSTHVTQHLDRDPNDPRNRAEAEALPSLDD